MDATDGYIVNKQPIYFVVKKNSNDKQPLDELEFVNYQAEVTGRKVNEQGQTLAGAVLQFTTSIIRISHKVHQ